MLNLWTPSSSFATRRVQETGGNLELSEISEALCPRFPLRFMCSLITRGADQIDTTNGSTEPVPYVLFAEMPVAAAPTNHDRELLTQNAVLGELTATMSENPGFTHVTVTRLSYV